MNSLLLETSGRAGWVALVDAKGEISVRHLDRNRRHARDLAPAVGDLLGTAGLSAPQIDWIAVSQGPGSYTGLRVGMASALAFRFATGCHLLLAPTFSLLAEMVGHELFSGATQEVTRLEIVADALKGWIYHEGFARNSQGIWESHRPLAVQTTEMWRGVRDPGALVLVASDQGPSCEQAGPEKERKPELVPWLECEARAVAVHPQAMARWCTRKALAQQWNDTDSAEPLYLRPSSAELQMETLSKGKSP